MSLLTTVLSAADFDPIFTTTIPSNIDMTPITGNAVRYIIPVPLLEQGWKTDYVSTIYNAAAPGQSQSSIAVCAVPWDLTAVMVLADHEIASWILPAIGGVLIPVL